MFCVCKTVSFYDWLLLLEAAAQLAAGTGTGCWGVRCTESTPAVTEHSEGCESQRCWNLRWRAATLGAGVPYKRRTARHLEEAIQSERM